MTAPCHEVHTLAREAHPRGTAALCSRAPAPVRMPKEKGRGRGHQTTQLRKEHRHIDRHRHTYRHTHRHTHTGTRHIMHNLALAILCRGNDVDKLLDKLEGARERAVGGQGYKDFWCCSREKVFCKLVRLLVALNLTNEIERKAKQEQETRRSS